MKVSEMLATLTGKNYGNNRIQEFVEIKSWPPLIFVSTTNSSFIIPLFTQPIKVFLNPITSYQE